MLALEATSLTKFYSAVPAVANVTFRINPGEVLGCVGPNGSGKSTTVKMLTGLLQPSYGEVFFGGKNIQNDLVGYRGRLGYVPEEADLYPFLSGWEYLELTGTLRGMTRSTLEKKSAALFELFALGSHQYSLVGSYSKGMRQRVLLMAALVHDPDILIFDEPLSGLDAISALIVKNLIQELGARGRIIFYCSHVLEVVEKVCSHLLILRKGQVVACAPTSTLQDTGADRSLESAFVQLVDDTDTERVAKDIVTVMGLR
jgi:ABC-2 type transport system ATP-binding protein